jgi:hypothetical protein
MQEEVDARTDRTGHCWLWTGYRHDRGYGQLLVDGSMWFAHRLAYELANGAIPAGMQIDHRCHVRACVRPSHLHAVTPMANQENRAGANRNSLSGVRGVSLNPRTRKWYARVTHQRRGHNAGPFKTMPEAEVAVVALRNALFTNNLTDRQG